jgi:SNF2 family DNA or RNA helicase
MGLGKTVQTITHLLRLKETGELTHPCCIVCPKSLVYNWFHELEKFAPSFTAEMIHASKEKDKFELEGVDIYIVPYDTMSNIVLGGLEKEFSYLMKPKISKMPSPKEQKL